jgi:hypothetical protein
LSTVGSNGVEVRSGEESLVLGELVLSLLEESLAPPVGAESLDFVVGDPVGKLVPGTELGDVADGAPEECPVMPSVSDPLPLLRVVSTTSETTAATAATAPMMIAAVLPPLPLFGGGPCCGK